MKAIHSILNVTVGVSTRKGFGECMHTSHSEPYLYEAATHVKCGTDIKSSSEDHASLCSGRPVHTSTSACAPHCEHLPVVLPVDSTGRCYTTEFSISESQQQKNFDGEQAKQCPCTSLCKPIE